MTCRLNFVLPAVVAGYLGGSALAGRFAGWIGAGLAGAGAIWGTRRATCAVASDHDEAEDADTDQTSALITSTSREPEV